MIRKVNGGYKVYSERGKPLSKPCSTKQQAQIEYFKNKK